MSSSDIRIFYQKLTILVTSGNKDTNYNLIHTVKPAYSRHLRFLKKGARYLGNFHGK